MSRVTRRRNDKRNIVQLVLLVFVKYSRERRSQGNRRGDTVKFTVQGTEWWIRDRRGRFCSDRKARK